MYHIYMPIPKCVSIMHTAIRAQSHTYTYPLGRKESLEKNTNVKKEGNMQESVFQFVAMMRITSGLLLKRSVR
jgi:hypothetical protein